MTKTDSPDPVAARSNLTYTVTVTNEGPATATGVRLIDRLPDVVFVSATPSQGTCVREGKGRRDGELTCDIGTLATGSSATVNDRRHAVAGRDDHEYRHGARLRARRRSGRQQRAGDDDGPTALT